MANPTGYDQHTRRNKDDEDINRHFFDKKLTGECKVIWNALKDENLALCHTLHEDPDMSSFYLYYTHNKKLAENIRELASKYFKIHNKDGDLYGDKIVDGLIALPHKKSGTIEDRMLEYGVPSITTETPGKVSLIKRVNFTKEVMKMVSSAK